MIPTFRRVMVVGCVVALMGALGCDRNDEPGNASRTSAVAAGAGAEGPPRVDLLMAARLALENRGVRTSGGIKLVEGGIEFTYETSQADGYDDELLQVWATVFGVLGEQAQEFVAIVNTVGGKPAAVVVAEVAAIEALAAGRIDSRAFFAGLHIHAFGDGDGLGL